MSLDFGLSYGWGILDSERAVDPLAAVGHWELDRRNEHEGRRWSRLQERFAEVSAARLKFDVLVYEKVRRHRGIYAAHAYGGCLALALEWADGQDLEVAFVEVADIREAATGHRGGKGVDKKRVYRAACNRPGWERHDFVNNDRSDAAFVGLAWLIINSYYRPTLKGEDIGQRAIPT